MTIEHRAGVIAALMAVLPVALLGACHPPADRTADAPPARAFPRATRPVASVVSTEWSTEAERDNHKEAQTVMDLAHVGPGSSVADIGAGEGYYTVRLGARVGAKGRVLAEDIDGEAMKRLGARVEHDRLGNVSIVTGASDDPRLPADSFDRVFLIHMYHEVTEPYAFLWRMRPALRSGGRIVVVDLDRPTEAHGTPPELLRCEFASVGYRAVQFVRKPEIAGYYAEFVPVGMRPAPSQIRACLVRNGQVLRGPAG